MTSGTATLPKCWLPAYTRRLPASVWVIPLSAIGVTLDLYSHVLPGMQADAAERVDEAIQRALKAAGKSVG
jgi:hypothetical protein